MRSRGYTVFDIRLSLVFFVSLFLEEGSFSDEEMLRFLITYLSTLGR